jgi:hypothetical protein
MKDGIIFILAILATMVVIVLSALLMMGCKSTIKVPEGITEKCSYTWSLLIAYHESSKNEGTKSGISMLLKDAQTECFNSIDNKRIREVSLICKKEVYKEERINLRDLKKKDQFTSCIKLYEGKI